MAIEPYGQEWEDQTYEQLAPQVQAMVQRIYGSSRGARFGASGALMAKRLASLKTEIALQAAKAKADVQERMRQEGVASAEKEKDRQSVVSREMMAHTNKLSDDALARSQKWQDDQTGVDRRSEAVKEIRRNEIYKALSEGKAWPEKDMLAQGIPEETIAELKQKGQVASPGSTMADNSIGSLRGDTAFTPRGDDNFLNPGDFASSRGFKSLDDEAPKAPSLAAPQAPLGNNLFPDIGLGKPGEVSPGFDAGGQGVDQGVPARATGAWKYPSGTRAGSESWWKFNDPVNPSEPSTGAGLWTGRSPTPPTRGRLPNEPAGITDPLKGTSATSFVPSYAPAGASASSGFDPLQEDDRLKKVTDRAYVGAGGFDPNTPGNPNTPGWNKDLWSGKITKRGFSDSLTNTGKTFADFWRSI